MRIQKVGIIKRGLFVFNSPIYLWVISETLTNCDLYTVISKKKSVVNTFKPNIVYQISQRTFNRIYNLSYRLQQMF